MESSQSIPVIDTAIIIIIRKIDERISPNVQKNNFLIIIPFSYSLLRQCTNKHSSFFAAYLLDYQTTAMTHEHFVLSLTTEVIFFPENYTMLIFSVYRGLRLIFPNYRTFFFFFFFDSRALRWISTKNAAVRLSSPTNAVTV